MIRGLSDLFLSTLPIKKEAEKGRKFKITIEKVEKQTLSKSDILKVSILTF